jgi:hypothetical protein
MNSSNNTPKTPRRERGPSAQRGLHLAETPQQDLLEALAGARTTLRLLDVVKTSIASGNEALDRLRLLSEAELAALRRETLDRVTDLRAELRRRGHT